jgi:hypothetical protein
VSAKRDGAALVGVGVAACAVCCAGPILGLLAAIGLGTAAAFALFGLVGFLAAIGIGLVMYLRRRRRSTCAPVADVVPVDPPRTRTEPVR